MILLCPLTDWKTATCSRGRAAGNVVSSRLVIASDSWNWAVGIQRGGTDEGKISSESFHGNMRLLLQALEEDKVVEDIHEATIRIIAALEKLTGEKIAYSKGETLEYVGRKIDKRCGTSHMVKYPSDVLQRVFRKEAEAE